MEHPSVTNFRDYLKIKSVQPNVNYDECVDWIKKQANQLDANFKVVECVKGKPIVILTIKGKDPKLQSIVLNSHMDVVPVYPEHWNYDPFSAYKDDNGDIYARGSQDMKCVAVQYIEAMKALKQEGMQLLRTVHITFAPDEEIGGADGLRKFVHTAEFAELNIGMALDEGYANPKEEMFVFYGERLIGCVELNIAGDPGHGSQFLPNNNGLKLTQMLNSFMAFRNAEEMKLRMNPKLSLGDVTTVNLTMIEGGVLDNVVPANIKVTIDVRASLDLDLSEFRKQMVAWCREAGGGIDLSYVIAGKEADNRSSVEDGKSIWWDTFSRALKAENIKIKKLIFPAATDGRYFREVGVPTYGFSPMNFTPRLLHDNNEFLNEKTFLRGIEIYISILTHIGNVE